MSAKDDQGNDVQRWDAERLAEVLCHEYHPMHWDVAYGNRTTGCGACRIHAFNLAPVLAAIRDEALAPIRALRDEHERAVNPAPYTSERALIERLGALLDGGVQS